MKTKTKSQKRVSWPDVLRVLPDAENRSYAVAALADTGFSLDSFASKTKAREAVARLEDRLEGKAQSPTHSGPLTSP